MNKTEIIKRLKSLAWRIGVMSLIAVLDWIMANTGLFNLPDLAVVLIGLVCGELTKWLNNNTALFGVSLK